jgi:hypothetical protein
MSHSNIHFALQATFKNFFLIVKPYYYITWNIVFLILRICLLIWNIFFPNMEYLS